MVEVPKYVYLHSAADRASRQGVLSSFSVCAFFDEGTSDSRGVLTFNSGNFYSDGASHSIEESGSGDVEDPTFYVGHAGGVNYFNLADDGEFYDAYEWHVYKRRELRAIEMERYVLQCADDIITWRDATLGFLEFYASVVRGMDDAEWVA
ncbi:hypothetical protein CYMTET_13240 [Cymbomonas tetramitiformis]|uniref:Uncharacterized protein n=1 Tax=Cymbomonas tetramitiformis TaxID=36881 RepID=A0AAE0GIR9_9CHLO|nr:hypothetical protein CYMTET_13240 [Cymbomonas tetramitiformis]